MVDAVDVDVELVAIRDVAGSSSRLNVMVSVPVSPMSSESTTLGEFVNIVGVVGVPPGGVFLVTIPRLKSAMLFPARSRNGLTVSLFLNLSVTMSVLLTAGDMVSVICAPLIMMSPGILPMP